MSSVSLHVSSSNDSCQLSHMCGILHERHTWACVINWHMWACVIESYIWSIDMIDAWRHMSSVSLHMCHRMTHVSYLTCVGSYADTCEHVSSIDTCEVMTRVIKRHSMTHVMCVNWYVLSNGTCQLFHMCGILRERYMWACVFESHTCGIDMCDWKTLDVWSKDTRWHVSSVSLHMCHRMTHVSYQHLCASYVRSVHRLLC